MTGVSIKIDSNQTSPGVCGPVQSKRRRILLSLQNTQVIPRMTYFKKGSKSYSIFNLKCPRCQEGEMFETGSYSMVKPFDMLERCPKCNLNYFPEPGYYYGAMFISYVWTGWFCLLFIAIFHWELGWSQNAAFGLLGIFLIFNFVYIFRISRLMWLNINFKYNSNAIEKFGIKQQEK
jgi:uncharacterized protein (DUF983 family)